MNIVIADISIADIDEALNYLRLELQDYYGHRVNANQRKFLLEQIDDLLEARLELSEGINEGDIRVTTRSE